MQKPILLFILFCFIIKTSDGQISKDNWIMGGSAGFSTLNSSSEAGLQFSQKDFRISAAAGYFLTDKFVIGIKPSFSYGSNSISISSTVIGIGPFVRYYLLSREYMFNLFTEGSYSYGNTKDLKQNGQRSNTYSLSGGPVIFINSSIGLEFGVSYATTKVLNSTGKINGLNFGVGFMFYLDKND